jgi:diacylglycerol kinase family enzyme
LQRVGGFDIRDVGPAELSEAMRRELARRPRRIAVAGGDGTIAMAAALVCRTDTELAVLPGGTLNHFAGDHGIPVDLDEAARLARHGHARWADVAYAGEHLFLNTSAVGTYVAYVRMRERIERSFGYWIATIVAAVRLLIRVPLVRVDVEIDGKRLSYETPLVFIGVGERELRAPLFGSRVAGGADRLHLMIVRERRTARLLAVALAAATRGVWEVASTPTLDSFLVDRCVIRIPGRLPRIALDGEIVPMRAPVEYRLERGALSVVMP